MHAKLASDNVKRTSGQNDKHMVIKLPIFSKDKKEQRNTSYNQQYISQIS